MECPYCNAENRDGVHFCSNCGKPLTPTITASSTGAGSANSNARTLTPGSRLQGCRYIIKKMLGQGGMGAAMLATDIRLDSKSVVIKELMSDNTDPARLQEDVRNFKREVATLAHLDHPLIPNVTDHFQEGSRYFMVQEYAEGENLEERMDRVNQHVGAREARGYITKVLDIQEQLPINDQPARTLNQQLLSDIERVLTRALKNDVNQRYQSAAAMKRDIDDILLKRFGVSGNISSYTLGTSGPMSTVSAASAPTAPYQPAQRQQQSPPRQTPPLSYPPPP